MIKQWGVTQQVSVIAASIAGVIVGLVMLAGLIYIANQKIEHALAQGQSLAKVIGRNSTAAIAFRDPGSAAEMLAAVEDSPNVIWAQVYLNDGTQFVEFMANNPNFQTLISGATPELAMGEYPYVREIRQPIQLGGTTIGQVVMWIDTWPAYADIFSMLWIGVLTWLVGTATVYALAKKLNGWVVAPLQDLSKLVLEVASDEDYSRRSKHVGDNDIGLLGASFNQMLRRTEDREQRLLEAINNLEEARDEAEAATRSKSSFLANMSHEIRTPMNGVVGMTSLLKRTSLTDKQKLYFDTIEKSASSLLMIIDDILDFTKIEAGRLEVKQQPFSLVETLAGVHAFFGETAQSKGLLFSIVQPDETIDRIIGDDGRVRQVLLNLVSNAIKFTDEGAVDITVSTLGEGSGRELRFEVSDTGIGIAESQREHIFSEFFQADVSSTRKFGGTGLGLAISYQLVVLMGGSVGFKSSLGEGSNFWFQIPLKTDVLNPFMSANASIDSLAQANPFEAALIHESSNEPLEESLSGDAFGARNEPSVQPVEKRWEGRVLVAEDSDVNQFIIRELLATFGVIPDIVANGELAVSAFEATPYNLIFMDIQMPVLDGLEATRRIRGMQKNQAINPECAIVGLSAHAMAGDRERCLAEGMDDYVTKPIHLDDLELVLNTNLRPVNDLMVWR